MKRKIAAAVFAVIAATGAGMVVQATTDSPAPAPVAGSSWT